MEKYIPSSSGIHDSQQEKAPQYHDVALRALSELLRHQASATVSEHVRHEFSRPSVESIVQRPTSSAGRPTGLVSRKRTRQVCHISYIVFVYFSHHSDFLMGTKSALGCIRLAPFRSHPRGPLMVHDGT